MKGNNSKLQYTFLYSLLALAAVQTAPAQTPERIWTTPRFGTFWSMQMTNQPPLPFLPDFLPTDTPLYRLGTNGTYVYDDRTVDYPALREFTATLDSLTGPPAPGEGGYGSGDTNAYPPTPTYGPGDLFLEIKHDPFISDYADLILHHATSGMYQWLATTEITNRMHVPPWVPGPVITAGGGTNDITWPAPPTVPTIGQKRFFRAAKGDTVVSIAADRYRPVITEPCQPNETNQPGVFTITVTPPVTRPLTVVYTTSGSAINRTDYTNLSGTITLPSNASEAQIYVQPLYDTNVEFQESVTLILSLTNGYLLDPDQYFATIWIEDCTNYFTVVATNVPSPASIDYSSKSNALVVGINFDTGEPKNLALIGTDHQVRTWSGLHGILGELKFAAIRDTNSAFTNGNIYFGNFTSGGIGMLSWDGTRSNLTWCQLTNELDYVNTLYADRTGIWSNELLAVTADTGAQGVLSRGIWRIHSQTNTEQIARITTYFLEGLLTVPDDPAYGPWAGKLITGDEKVHSIYALSIEGSFQSYDLGIDPDDFHIIEEGQDINCVNFQDNDPFHSQILKISRNLLTPYIGGILIDQAGETPGSPASLFIVAWNASQQRFDARRIRLPDSIGGHLEHATLAPINIPDL